MDFCLACCRFAMDDRLPKLKPSDMPKDTALINEDGLAGGQGKRRGRPRKAVAA
jgi:hypothetical protein